jgi:hypothetical protein
LQPVILQGSGTQVGAGNDPMSLHREFFPGMRVVRAWDMPDGGAQRLAGVANASRSPERWNGGRQQRLEQGHHPRGLAVVHGLVGYVQHGLHAGAVAGV